ncbi:MAG: hypothetical protein FWB84_08095 [Candidatus Bathyarchaeota archaeon]|uniref:hypothetical protein n=1 Tax=Candidatus Bathycorpusculum sp. TaxID=2994959 RepID=UPI00281EDEB8|nr:hypothetical protein [Candidatus Termiticorpusculum sp.]MCL2257542.1 hypothetical protein [Candidatus Termiticorpusculum sp.]MCL2292126.1 hypothetical protein [Candidatus Termiticorpusculum sp.]
MRIVLSSRIISLILVVVLLVTALNVGLVINVYSKVNDVGQTDSSGYEYVVSQTGSTFQVKNTFSKDIINGFASASIAINYALSQGNTVYLKGIFDLNADVVIFNSWNAKLVGESAIINANGYSIIIRGDDYTYSKYPIVSGLILNGGTLRIENTFGATVTNIVFRDCLVGLEFANDNTWTEFSKVENCHFINCTEGIAFRTPKGVSATGSYESTEINRCFFNQYDHSIAINVENRAELSCSQLQNVRIWIGEYGNTNQTGLRMAGSMSQTLLVGVVFESFSKSPDLLFGIDIIETASTTPIMDSNISFLGSWTASVHNSASIWLSAVGTSYFAQKDLSVHIGLNGKFGVSTVIKPVPLKIASFKPKIEVNGNFNHGETITVRVKLEYIDNTYSKEIEKVFFSGSTVWFTDDDLLEMYPSQNIVTAIIVDAACSLNSTDATVKISGYGTAG